MINQEEEWRPIKGFEGKYEISSIGRIKSLPRKGRPKGGILGKHYNTCGYVTCGLALGKTGHGKTLTVHRLVAIAFIPKPSGNVEVNHKNGIRDDNRVENLEWITHQQNIKHAFDIGIKSQIGEKCPRSILKNNQVIEIRDKYQYGVITQSMLAREFGVSKSTIKNILSGRQWKHLL